LISPYIAFLLINARYKEALVWAFLGGISDLFDGSLARWMGRDSSFGAAFDPLADKIFAFFLFFTCVYLGWIPKWFLGITLLRELIILGGIYFLSLKINVVELKPLWSSKINTMLQFLLLGGMIIKNILPLWGVVEILLVATTITTLYSGIEYIYVGIEMLKNSRS
jgi:cardiolipin synthase